MIVLYNIIQIVLLIIAGPFLLVKVLLTAKYRGRILQRLGIGLKALDESVGVHEGRRSPRIWIHALSVGEVSSARPLVIELRRVLPEAVILFSATTRTGEALALTTLAGVVDHFIPYPFDFLLSVRKSLDSLRPDIFILVETDFWPNFLRALQGRSISALLVNGRVSEASFVWYQRFMPLFQTIFSSFRILAVQTAGDSRKMIGLGVPGDRVKTIGNLKYDSALPTAQAEAVVLDRQGFGIPEKDLLLVAGSTHPGEEEIIFAACQALRKEVPHLFLVVAPRNTERGAAVAGLALAHGLAVHRRTDSLPCIVPQVLVLDTIGELAGLYGLCEVAFVGGSLVQAGGHNPLEPACYGKPVLFGPHMEDFAEIAGDLLTLGGAFMVTDRDSLQARLKNLLLDEDRRRQAGGRALALVDRNRGVAGRHAALILEILKEAGVS